MTARTSDVRWLLKDALRVVSKRNRLILGVFLIVALGISLAVVNVPTSYEVAGKLVVTRERGDLLVTPTDQRNFNFAVTAPTIQDLAVHAELLKNRSLVEAVVKQLGLDRGGATSASEPRLNGQVDTILAMLLVQRRFDDYAEKAQPAASAPPRLPFDGSPVTTGVPASRTRA